MAIMKSEYEYILEWDVAAEKLEDFLNEAGRKGFRMRWMKPTDPSDKTFAVLLERLARVV